LDELLPPSDVDLSAGVHGMLRIRAKTVEGVSWEPKTGQERGVPINSSLRPFLEAYTALVQSGRVWFFPSPKGKRWDPDGFSHRLRDINRAAGLPWSALDFRHTFGSQLAMKGETLFKISALMGNSPEICRRHYAALLPESLVECVEFPDVGDV
jgi:integrase